MLSRGTPRRQTEAPTTEDASWHHATSQTTVASIARLEAVANTEAQALANEAAKLDSLDICDGTEKLTDGCRLAYSSVLNVSSAKEAQTLLARIFTVALTKNPPKQIGGTLFYDEKTSALVQVLEGPASAVRSLYHNKIKLDPRHTSVKLLWDHKADHRQYEGFGMQLGSDPTSVLQDAKSDLLQLTYLSQLQAPSRDAAYEHIEAILGVAIVTNPKLGIGGALFLNPRTLQVLQALEGPEANVRTLYEKIAKDARHTGCTIISEAAVKRRTYEQWGMLQGDLADWSSIAVGKVGMENVVSRRRRRGAKEEMGESCGEDKEPEGNNTRPEDLSTPAQSQTMSQAIKGELHMSTAGPVIVVQGRDGEISA